MTAPAELKESAPSAEIREGLARIRFPSANQVFYNPVQEFNRDLSVACIRTWLKLFHTPSRSLSLHAESSAQTETAPVQKCEKIRILEGLSATGLRSIRYALELPTDAIQYIVANDISVDAVQLIRQNAIENGLSTDFLRPNHGDANLFMYQNIDTNNQFHVIDLDPYGTASPFLDAAVQSIRDGGLLCVTCTDMAVLAGKYPETCFAKYGGVSMRGDPCHEMALRLLLHAIQSSASRYKRHITPLMSCSIDFYIRVFVRVHQSPLNVKSVISKTSLFYQCSGCSALHHSPFGVVHLDAAGNPSRYSMAKAPTQGGECRDCRHPYMMSGPAWSGPLHSAEFVRSLLLHLNEEKSSTLYGTHNRMRGMISLIAEEIDTILYYTYSGLCKAVRSGPIPMLKMNSALLNAGYQVSQTHCNSNGFKTDAPISFLWDILREWAKEHPIKLSKYPEGSPSVQIMSKPCGSVVSFEAHPKANPQSRLAKMTRFEDHKGLQWGPKARAKRRRQSDEHAC